MKAIQRNWVTLLLVLACALLLTQSAVASPGGDFTNFDGVQVGDGTAAAPSVAFTSDTDSGLYRIGANNVGLTVNGAKVLDVGTSGLTVTGALASTGGSTLTGSASIRNSATGNVTLDFRDYADTTDDDMAHAVLTTNCTNTGSAAEDCDFTVGVVEDGAAADTRLNIDADAGVVIGSATTNSFTVTTDGTGDAEVVLPAQAVGATEVLNDTLDFAQMSDTPTLDAALTIGGDFDITLASDSTGGNAGAKSEIIGLPRIKLVGTGAGTNGTTETTSYTDDSSTGEYAPIDADVTEAEGSGDGVYRIGASSYKALFAGTATADDGFKRTIAGDDLEANESIGFWLYSSVTLASGDLQILLTDDGGARNFNIGAVTTANKWTWMEVDISALAGGTGDVVSEFGITLTAQGAGALGAFNLYMDGAYKWDATDEEALGAAIQQNGVLSVLAVATAAGSVNTQSALVEDTDYFVHYETGNDFIVWITDQSANSAVELIAY